MFRLKAALLHFLLSICIILTTAAIVYFSWFPTPFIWLDGTVDALLILIVVDLFLGPIITLLIASELKPRRELLRDISIILVLQLGAFGYGIYLIEGQRVVAIVYIDNDFLAITKESVVGGSEGDIALQNYNGIFYGMLLPDDFRGVNNKKEAEGLIFNPKRYRELDVSLLQDKQLPRKFVPDYIFNEYKMDAVYLSLAGKRKGAVVVVDKKSKVVEIDLAVNVD